MPCAGALYACRASAAGHGVMPDEAGYVMVAFSFAITGAKIVASAVCRMAKGPGVPSGLRR
jgi:hypothetical protein